LKQTQRRAPNKKAKPKLASSQLSLPRFMASPFAFSSCANADQLRRNRYRRVICHAVENLRAKNYFDGRLEEWTAKGRPNSFFPTCDRVGQP